MTSSWPTFLLKALREMRTTTQVGLLLPRTPHPLIVFEVIDWTRT